MKFKDTKTDEVKHWTAWKKFAEEHKMIFEVVTPSKLLYLREGRVGKVIHELVRIK